MNENKLTDLEMEMYAALSKTNNVLTQMSKTIKACENQSYLPYEVQTLARYCDRFLEAQIIPALEKAEIKAEKKK
jgi:hypothetical protein